MDFAYDATTEELRERLLAFMDERVYPAEPVFAEQMRELENPWAWTRVPVLEELKAEARTRGLWNLFLPGDHGAGLTNLQYAPLAEITGRSVHLAPAALNCAAPDTGNMEVLHMFGTDEQKKQWLEPLLDGRDPVRVRDDRARRRLLRRHEHRDPHRARRRRLRHQRAQVVDHRGDEPQRQDLHRDGQDRPDRRPAPPADDDPGARATPRA